MHIQHLNLARKIDITCTTMKQSVLLVIFEISMKMEVKAIFSVSFMLFTPCTLLQLIYHATCTL